MINAGSVGKPKDGDSRACYLLLHENAGQIEAEFVRVAYDIERAAGAIEAEPGMPDAFAVMLREGRG